MPAESYARLRDLGNLEKYSSTRHALGLYNNVSLTAYYYRPAKSSRSLPDYIYLALAKVIAEHPALSAIPVEEDLPTAHFVRLPQVDLDRAVTFIERKRDAAGVVSHDEELDEVLEQQHNTNFKSGLGDSPYWRLIILHRRGEPDNFVASFIFHHALADGGSGLAFHRAFHAALVGLDVEASPGPATESNVVTPSTTLIPSLEELHSLPLTIWFILLALWSSVFPSKTTDVWAGPPISFSYHKRRIKTAIIPQANTDSLVAACRAEGTSLTAVVPVLLASAVFSNLDPSKWVALRASMPISLRHILPADVVTNDTIGVFVSQAQTTFRRAELRRRGSDQDPTANTWTAAKTAKASLSAAVARKGRNDVVGLLRWAGPLKSYLLQKKGKQPETAFEFSNVGVLKYAAQPGQNNWKIGRVVFGQDGNVVGPAFQTAGATGPNGELAVSFAWLDGQIEEHWMLKVIKDFEDEIERVIAFKKSQ